MDGCVEWMVNFLRRPIGNKTPRPLTKVDSGQVLGEGRPRVARPLLGARELWWIDLGFRRVESIRIQFYESNQSLHKGKGKSHYITCLSY